ncbi:MAG: gp53-like domain-containing protein [Shewanella sp.]
MPKPSTPAIWASNKAFSFSPNAQQIAQGFDYIATIGRPEGAPITDDHDWPFNQITVALKWVMDQLPDGGIQALLTALLPKRTFSANDFIRIPDVPGGLIIQWGKVTIPTGGSWTFPTVFPNSLLGFSVIHGPAATGVVNASVSTANNSGIQILHSGANNIFTCMSWGF